MIEGGIKENCVYITMGGYVVEIVRTNYGLCLASSRTSPGKNCSGNNVAETTLNGWTYNKNGKMSGLTDFWNKNLEIVAQICDLTKLDFDSLPPNIHLVDGYPMVKSMEEEFMPGYKSYGDDYSLYDKYISSYNKLKNEPDFKKYMKFAEEKLFTAPTSAKEVKVKPPNPAVEFGKRMFTYWLFEPTKTMALQAAKSVRYAIVLSILGSAGYGSFHPDQIKNFVAKCLPKVSIQAPEIIR